MSGNTPSTTANQCIFSANENLCKTLNEIGIPADEKWRTLILYLRSVKEHDYLTDPQKRKIQSVLMSVVNKRNFSNEEYHATIDESKRIIAEPYNKKLQDAIIESSKLLEDFMQLMNRRKKNVEQLGDHTLQTLRKEEDPKVMIAKVRQTFQTVIAAMEDDVDRLSRLSYTDALTGLNNRRSFDEFLERSSLEALQNHRPLNCVYIDIDDFKKFNDTYGHRTGDQALMVVAKVIKSLLDELEASLSIEGFAARHGGEEFALLLPLIDLPAAVTFAEKIRKGIASYHFVIRDIDGQITESDITLTASFGVAELDAKWGKNYSEKLCEAADKALYIAKKSGKNVVCKG